MQLQTGQAMAEYVIVCAALITALFWGANVECDGSGNGSDKCISKLLTVMHDNYDGYSSSISGVQKYGAYAASGDPVTGGGGPDAGGGPGSGGGGDGTLNPDGLTEIKQVTSDNGLAVYGELLPDGSVVDANGDVVGFYSDVDDTFTDNSGNTTSAVFNSVVLDEEGNVLHLRAVTSCTPTIPNLHLPKPVYSWGYVSKASDKVFNSLNKEEMDIGSLCTEPSFKVVKNGQSQGGRILNSEYFAAVFAVDVSANPLAATANVIYWDDLGICSVMVKGWDAEVDPDNDKDEDEIYAAQLLEFNDDDKNLGEIDKIDYFNQTVLYGVPTQLNDCPTTIIISKP